MTPDLSGMTLAEMIASVRTWYHRIQIGEHTTPGRYDMARVLGHYGLPDDLAGQDVLDVGTSNGFFAFEMERRNAHVVATELPGWRSHDFPDWFREQERDAYAAIEADVDWNEVHGGFTVAHRALASRVERRLCTVYELPEVCGERFDLAVCSNVFVHLRDPIAGLQAIRAVLRPGGRAIFATPIEHVAGDVSGARFVGDARLCAWWVPSPKGFVQWCTSAGYANARVVATFPLSPEGATAIENTIAVVHCDRP